MAGRVTTGDGFRRLRCPAIDAETSTVGGPISRRPAPPDGRLDEGIWRADLALAYLDEGGPQRVAEPGACSFRRVRYYGAARVITWTNDAGRSVTWPLRRG